MKKLLSLIVCVLLFSFFVFAESDTSIINDSLNLKSDVDAKIIMRDFISKTNYNMAQMNCTLINYDSLGSITTEFKISEKDKNNIHLEVTSGVDYGQKILRKNNDIYVYYPSSDEIIRLTNSSKQNNFLGGSFAYEDMVGDKDYEKNYTFELLEDKMVNEVLCYCIKLVSKSRNISYQTQIIYIDKESNLAMKIEMYSRSGKLLKTLYYSSYNEINGIYVPYEMEMVNEIKRNSKSTMSIKDIFLNVDLDNKLFEKENLTW